MKYGRLQTEQCKCMNCNYGHRFFVHADYNAAKNISTPDIEKEIREQLEAQKEYEEKMKNMSNKRLQNEFENVY